MEVSQSGALGFQPGATTARSVMAGQNKGTWLGMLGQWDYCCPVEMDWRRRRWDGGGVGDGWREEGISVEVGREGDQGQQRKGGGSHHHHQLVAA